MSDGRERKDWLPAGVNQMPPTIGNGKICYIEIPATDVARSAEFYKQAFGWSIRTRGDGATAFDDGVGEVSGAWVLGRPPAATPGLMVYIMVDSVAATIEEGDCRRWRDCSADRSRCAGDYGALPRSGRQCAGALSGTG